MNKLFLPLMILGVVLLAGCLGGQAEEKAQPVIEAATATPSPTPAPTATPSPVPTIKPDGVETDRVTVLYSSFEPKVIRVKAGTKVTWFNEDGRLHSVRSSPTSPEQFNSFNIAGRQSWSYTFNKPGTFEYYDDVTNAAQGIVYVDAA